MGRGRAYQAVGIACAKALGQRDIGWFTEDQQRLIGLEWRH